MTPKCDDDDYEEPLSPREIELALRGFMPRSERRWLIQILKRAQLALYHGD